MTATITYTDRQTLPFAVFVVGFSPLAGALLLVRPARSFPVPRQPR